MAAVLLTRHHPENPFPPLTGVDELISRTFYYSTLQMAPSLCGVVSSVSIQLNNALPFRVLCQVLVILVYLYLPAPPLAMSVQQ
jgi:hypothetical protein